jgi:hypothetical protein
VHATDVQKRVIRNISRNAIYHHFTTAYQNRGGNDSSSTSVNSTIGVKEARRFVHKPAYSFQSKRPVAVAHKTRDYSVNWKAGRIPGCRFSVHSISSSLFVGGIREFEWIANAAVASLVLPNPWPNTNRRETVHLFFKTLKFDNC